MNCSTCGDPVFDVKYHTADGEHVFCDAYCSFEYYSKKDDRTSETRQQ